MTARTTFGASGLSPEAEELASRVFGPPPPPSLAPRPNPPPASARRSIPWTALAIFALAVAVAFHAIMFRYQTLTTDVVMIRTDRLTGQIVRCYTTAPVCAQPAVVHVPKSAGDLSAIAEDARQEIRDSISGEQAKRGLDSLAAINGKKSPAESAQTPKNP